MIRRRRHRNADARRWTRRLLRDTRAATAVEYGLILALIVLAVMGSLIGVADVTTNMWANINAKVSSAH